MIYYSIILFLSCALPAYQILAEELPTSEKPVKPQQPGEELLLCRKCGSDVADSFYLFNKLSPGARKTEKQNLFGRQNVSVQTLVNPFGINFDIVTAEKARCENLGLPQGADSWFPGYVWRICACPRCGHHLGWTFESVADPSQEKPKDQIQQFHGLILSNVLGENYNDANVAAKKQDALDGIRYRFPNNDAENIQDVNENRI
ncbi:protein cereblon-like isoform X2 [Pectinophora gossypiella]|uniref:protein cereblon-like isoform X2 n=1 Tax=Pectinophora gossypiella TaxID=13191 RepID=UPI00214E3FC6|nr:protein cereblon-like isoform X2 [Pectinophora gossypiella]